MAEHGEIEEAARRLARALDGLERKVSDLHMRSHAPIADNDLFAFGAGPSERERALESAAREASAAVTRAAEEVRSALREAG